MSIYDKETIRRIVRNTVHTELFWNDFFKQFESSNTKNGNCNVLIHIFEII